MVRQGPSKAPQQDVSQTGGEPSLFDYKPDKSGNKKPKTKVVSSTRKSRNLRLVADKPVIRTPIGFGRVSVSGSPTQRELTLEVSGSAVERPSPPAVEEPSSPGTEILNRGEVILSRLLAGIIDGSFSLLVAFVFTLSASEILRFDLISSTSMRLGLMLSFCFFFFNSVFFFVLSGQTPGMYLTDLRLVAERSEEVSLVNLLLRVFLFLPATATVVGLLWGAFDPGCRCIHDHLSRTRIVPMRR